MKKFGKLSGLTNAVLLMGMACLLVPQARASTVLLSNLPVNDGLDLGMLNTQAYATGFTLLADYVLDSATLRLRTSSVAPTPAQVSVALYSDNGNQPGTLLEALSGSPSFSSSTTNNYSYTPTSSITLQSGQTYWVVLHYTGSLTLYWAASDPPAVPTGSGATYDMTLFANPFGGSWTHQTFGGQDLGPALEVQGTAVASTPEPGTSGIVMLGLVALLAVTRWRESRMRRRAMQTEPGCQLLAK